MNLFILMYLKNQVVNKSLCLQSKKHEEGPPIWYMQKIRYTTVLVNIFNQYILYHFTCLSINYIMIPFTYLISSMKCVGPNQPIIDGHKLLFFIIFPQIFFFFFQNHNSSKIVKNWRPRCHNFNISQVFTPSTTFLGNLLNFIWAKGFILGVDSIFLGRFIIVNSPPWLTTVTRVTSLYDAG